MDGVHDMGGKQGYGPIEFSESEARGEYDPFPTEEGARAWAAAMAVTNPTESERVGGFFRFVRECVPPVEYLERPYAEQWLTVTAAMMNFGGILSMEEIRSGMPDGKWQGDAPLGADETEAVARHRDDYERPVENTPLFAPGDAVKTSPFGATGHTRLPAYVQGREGVIHAHHGAHILPDTGVHGQGGQPTHLYTVSFRASDLWPERAGSNDRVFLDLWECYLENE